MKRLTRRNRGQHDTGDDVPRQPSEPIALQRREEPGWHSASPLPGLLGGFRLTLPTLLLAFRRVVFAANVRDAHVRRRQL
jgi:hypothetical protein